MFRRLFISVRPLSKTPFADFVILHNSSSKSKTVTRGLQHGCIEPYGWYWYIMCQVAPYICDLVGWQSRTVWSLADRVCSNCKKKNIALDYHILCRITVQKSMTSILVAKCLLKHFLYINSFHWFCSMYTPLHAEWCTLRTQHECINISITVANTESEMHRQERPFTVLLI